MKYIYLLFFFGLVSCFASPASKNADLMSPCAGCDNRVSPAGNLKYIV